VFYGKGYTSVFKLKLKWFFFIIFPNLKSNYYKLILIIIIIAILIIEYSKFTLL